MERFASGIKELNDIVGGLPFPSAILVQGKPGCGKTLFSLHTIAVDANRKKIVVLTNNYPKEIQDQLADMGIKIENIQFIDCYSWLAGKKADIDSLSNLSRILAVIDDSLNANALVIFDCLTPLLFYNSEESIERFLQELIAIIKAKNCLLLVVLDSGSYKSDTENTFQALVDGIIDLDIEKGMKILKMRDTKTPERTFFYDIGEKGLKLRKT